MSLRGAERRSNLEIASLTLAMTGGVTLAMTGGVTLAMTGGVTLAMTV